MSSFLAQCPHCMTSFRVSGPHLDAAGGMVRCGACLGVFSAPANRITIRQAMSPEQIAAGLVAAIADDDALDMSVSGSSGSSPGLELNYAVTLSYGKAGQSMPQHPLQELQVPVIASPPEATGNEDSFPNSSLPDAEPLAAEVIAGEDLRSSPWLEEGRNQDIQLGDMDLDMDDQDEAGRDRSPTPGDADSNYFADIRMPGDFSAEPRTARVDASVPGRAGTDDLDDLSVVATPAVSAPGDFDDLIDDGVLNDYDYADDDVAEDDDDHGVYENPGSAHPSEEAVRHRNIAADDKEALREYLAALEDDEALESLGSFDFDAFNDEPVTITSAQVVRRRLLSFSALCLSLLLALQIGLFYIDRNLATLSQEQRFAQFMPLVCSILECPLAQRRSDLSSLYSQELLIRSHPRYPSALEVSFIFRNDASAPQPFPAIELGFSDVSNRVLVNRLFQPAEYLPPELRDLQEMPAQSSLQIQLELADPGTTAVNYTLAFREP